MQLRLGDGEAATMRLGSRYPFRHRLSQASGPAFRIYRGLPARKLQQPVFPAASYSGSLPNIPQVEYQNLGLTLKATPKVMRNDEVALTVDLKIDALAGTFINAIRCSTIAPGPGW